MPQGGTGGVGKHLWEWDASSLLTQRQRNPQHLKWLPRAGGEEAAVETGAQGWCALGKLPSKSGQLHDVPSQALRCIPSPALFTEAMHESNMGVNPHGITVVCNVQKNSCGAWALSHLMKGAADHSVGLCIWPKIIPHQAPSALQNNPHLLCEDFGRGERGDWDGTAAEEEVTYCPKHSELLEGDVLLMSSPLLSSAQRQGHLQRLPSTQPRQPQLQPPSLFVSRSQKLGKRFWRKEITGI